ncbi:hypothetical protein V8E53_013877 [Lactarius tabidus]
MLDGLHFKQLSTSRTLVTRARTLGRYEWFVMVMSEGNVNHLDALLRLLDWGRKEEEMSCRLLFLLAHQTLGAPMLSTLHYGSAAKSTVTSLSPSAGFPTRSEVQRNLRAAFKNSCRDSRCGYILMIDEIKVEERLRWDPSSNKILGFLDFCSISNARIHHASEVIFLIGILSENRLVQGSRPFIVVGTCKREHSDRHAQLISLVIEACNTEMSTIGCPLFSIRRSALTTLTHLFILLGKLHLMNVLDPKHVIKRCRNFTIRKSGIMIDGFVITPALLHFHLQANEVPSHCIAYLLNPSDRQDVTLCFTLLKEIWSLPPPVPTDKPGFVAARGALLMLGSLFRHLVLPFVQVSLSLHDQLVYLSAAAHLTVFLFTAMPVLTFKDIVLLVKICTPDGKFYLILNGTDWLESTFGVVRTMVRNDANANILTLGHRLSHAVECLNILSEHPEWDRSPRHLHLRGIKDSNGDVCSKWNIDVRNISLVTAWNLGRHTLASKFPASDIEEALLELESKGHDMEFPFGKLAECPEASDDDECDDTSVPQPVQSLSSQDATKVISSLKPGKGERFPKARVLRELERATFSKVPGSTDHLNWCARLSCYLKTSALPDLACGLTDDSTSGTLLSIGDPAATVVQCEGQFFLAIIQINEILFNTSPVLEIITVQFQIYQIIETSQDDPDNRRLECAVLKMAGSFIQVISPAIAIPEVNTPVYYFQMDELQAIAACLFSSRSSQFPYRTTNAEIDECPITGPSGAQSNHCPVCQPAIPWDINKAHKILEHVATHTLFDGTLDTTKEPCGLCMRPSPLCSFYLRKGKGARSTQQIDKHVSHCPNFMGKLFYLAVATERTNSPCTNVPVTCPLCPSTSAAVWKYNMKTHLVRIHPSTKGGDFPKTYVISESEKAALKIQWENHYSVLHRRRRHNATSRPLAVSKVHSSRQAFS